MKARNLLKRAVIDESRGVIVGQVEDIVVNRDLTIKGLVVETEAGAKTLSVEDYCLGEDVVLIRDGDCLEHEWSWDNEIRYQERLGQLIMNHDGKELGILSDLVFKPEGNSIQGFEISSGLLKDFVDGRAEVPLEKVKNIGEDTLLIGD